MKIKFYTARRSQRTLSFRIVAYHMGSGGKLRCATCGYYHYIWKCGEGFLKCRSSDTFACMRGGYFRLTECLVD